MRFPLTLRIDRVALDRVALDRVALDRRPTFYLSAIRDTTRNPALRVFLLVLLPILGWALSASPLAAAEGGCFAAGTPITLANGRHLPIERITAGSRVRSVMPDGRVVHATVRAVLRFEGRSLFRLTTAGGLSVLATGEHPVGLGEGKFRNVADLFAGIPIVCLAPLPGIDKVLEVRPQPGLHTVFNLEVDEPRTFVAGGILVHNTSRNPATSASETAAFR